MKIAISILQKVIVNYFYSVNAGFFFFIFFVLFGIPYDVLNFHLSIINFIIQSQSFLLLVMLLWLLYNFKCMDYTIKQLNNTEQQFLFCLDSLPFFTSFVYLLYVQLMVYLPALLYSIVIAIIAVKKNNYLCASEIILFNISILLITVFVYLRALQKRILFSGNILRLHFNFRFNKPFFTIPIFFLLKSRKQMLFITKLFSLSIVYAFIQLYQPEQYDIRPIMLCFMICTTAHCAIVFQTKNFTDVFMVMEKNFPFSIIKRFFLIVLLYCCLLIPEFLFIWKGYPVYFNAKDYFQLLVFGISLLALFHAVLFTNDMSMDEYIKIVFWILAALFFVILYNPGFFLPGFLLLIAFGFFKSYYYDFEKNYS